MSYIKEKEIESISDTTVTFKDWTTETYTVDQMEYIVTDEPKDPSQYREILFDKLMPLIMDIVHWDNTDLECSVKIMELYEKHDLESQEIEALTTRIQNNRINEYNEKLKEIAWDVIEQFEKDINKIKDIDRIIMESYQNLVWIAMWKTFWTFDPNKPIKDSMDTIRFSQVIKKVNN